MFTDFPKRSIVDIKILYLLPWREVSWGSRAAFSKIALFRNNEAIVLIIQSSGQKDWNSGPVYLNGLRRIRIPSFASIKKRQDLGLVPNPAEVRIHLYLCMNMLRIMEFASWIMDICSVYVCLEESWIPKPFLCYLYIFHNSTKNHWRSGISLILCGNQFNKSFKVYSEAMASDIIYDYQLDM